MFASMIAHAFLCCSCTCITYLCYIVCHHEGCNLKQHTFIILQCLRVSAAQLDPLLKSFIGVDQAMFLSGAWSSRLISPGYWQNSVPFTCRAQVPIFLLAVTRV